ncbi:hypothetical protein Tco_0669954 [Tanacetum coccineum]
MQSSIFISSINLFSSVKLVLVLSNEDLQGTRTEHGFKQAFISLFGQDVETFTCTIFLYVDQLEKQLDKDEFQEDDYMDAFWMQRQEGDVDRGKALDADLVVTESSGTESKKHDTNINSGNYITYAVDADIRLHSVQSEHIYDTHMLEKFDSNTTPDSTNMFHRGGVIDQNAEKCQVTSPLLNLSLVNMITKFANQSLESENIFLKKTVAQFQKNFSRMEAHCVNLELKHQNQALKFEQHGQILNETSNKAKIKKEIELLETINIELEHSVAKLLAENDVA